MKRWLLWTVVLIACESPSATEEPAFDVRGGWTYAATQTIPALDIAGTLQITERNGATFTGTVAFTETDVQGTQRTRAGALAGRFVGSSVVDMDIHIETEVRRHVARVYPDSMSGTWSVTGAPSLSGAFRARRLP